MPKNKKLILKKILFVFLCIFAAYTFLDEIFAFCKKQGLAYNCVSQLNLCIQTARFKRQFAKAKKNFSPQTPWLENNNIIAQAFGGIDGISYTNSLEAFEKNYAAGQRVFEVDFSLTSDDYLVACNDWDHFSNIAGTNGVPTYAQFKAAKIYDKYTPLGIADIIKLMKDRKDFYIVTDNFFPGNESECVKKLVEACDGEEKILDRFIIQVYTDKNFSEIDKIYHFKNYIYTLYIRGKDDLEQNAKFCVMHSIPIVTMWDSWATSEAIEIYKNHGIKVFVHTVNDLIEFFRLTRKGVFGIYTDFISQAELNKNPEFTKTKD